MLWQLYLRAKGLRPLACYTRPSALCFANWHSQLAGWGHTLIQGLCPWISFGSIISKLRLEMWINTSPSGWYFNLPGNSSIQGLRPWISFGPSLQGKAKALPCAKGLRPFGCLVKPSLRLGLYVAQAPNRGLGMQRFLFCQQRYLDCFSCLHLDG